MAIYLVSFKDLREMIKISSGLAVALMAMGFVVGCGGSQTYEVPEVDEKVSAEKQAEIGKQMQEEMQKQMGGGNK